MKAGLPQTKLIAACTASVCRLREPIENRCPVMFLQNLMDRSRCEAFEVAHYCVQVRSSRRDEVSVTGHENECMHFQASVLSTESQAFDDGIDIRGIDKQRQPVKYRDRAEVWAFLDC